MNYYSEIDVATRKQAFETMAYSYAKTKGYNLYTYCLPETSIPVYSFCKGDLRWATAMVFEDPEEIYATFDRIAKRVEEALEPSKCARELGKTGAEGLADRSMLNSTFGRALRSGKSLAAHAFLEKEFHIPPLKGPAFRIPRIKDVIFNEPATIVFWGDGTKTVVKCQEYDEYDPEKGLAMAISKKALGNDRKYYHTFLKCLKKYDRPEPKGTTLEEMAKSVSRFNKAVKNTPFFGMKHGD